MQNTFGSRLKQFRKACGLTQEQLAEKLNIHERTVSRWERDVCNPDMSMFGLIADILHVSLEELWGLPANKRIENGKFDIVSLGHELSVQRIRLGESQGELAQAVGVSSDTVSKWERGLISPSLETFIALAKHFDIAPSALYYAKAKLDYVGDSAIELQGSVAAVKSFFSKRTVLIVALCALCFMTAVALILSFCLKPVFGNASTPNDHTVCEHQYVSSVTAPTCTAQGFTTFTCTKCGNSYQTEYTAKTEHDFGEWVIAREPTCTSEGSMYKVCSACRAKSASEKIATAPHEYATSVTAPTCAAQGFTTFTCTKCGNSYQAEYTAKTEHDFGEWVIAREPTCTSEGSMYKVCSACGAKSASEEIATASHEYATTVTQPTCAAQGFTTYSCTVCGDSYKSDYTALAAHKYEKTITRPTCSTQGYTTYSCTLCGDSFQSDYTALLPHTESEWEMRRVPTCANFGSQRKRCLVCHKTIEITTVDKLPHNYKQQIIEPSGADAGYILYTCNTCGDSYKDGYFTNLYDGIEYEFNFAARTCVLKSAEEFTGDRLEIPKTVNGCTVTEIGWAAFSDCITLREVTIPDTVNKIDLYAFYRCALLEKVVVPDSVTFLGDEAFCGCRGLKEATLPKNITRIRYSTFSDCVNLRKIEIPQSVTVIEDLAFHNCPKLPNIVLPDQLFSIGSYAFYGCSSLERMEIPSGVARIGERAFEGCSALVEVVFCKKTKWTADETVLNEAELADSRKAAQFLTVLYYNKIWLCE